MDPEANEKSTEEFNIFSYPAIILFKNGKQFRVFSGDLHENIFKNWLKHKLTVNPFTLLSKDQVDGFVKTHEACIVGYFKSKDDAEYRMFQQQLDEFKQMDEFEKAVVFGQLQETSIQLFMRGGKSVKFQDSIKTFPTWILFNGFPPLVQNYTYKIYSRIDESDIPLGLLYYNSTDKEKKELRIIEELAEDFKYKILFAHSDGIQHKDDIYQLSGKHSSLPLFVIIKIATAETFIYDDKFDKPLLKTFIDKVLNGEIEPIHPPAPSFGHDEDHKFQEVLPEDFEQLKKTLNSKKDEL